MALVSENAICRARRGARSNCSGKETHPNSSSTDDDLVVPVELQVGVEYEAVRDAVVARLKEVADLIRAPGKSR